MSVADVAAVASRPPVAVVRRPPVDHSATTARFLGLMLVLVIFGQRLALPIGDGVSASILALPVMLLVLGRRRLLVIDPGRTCAYLAAASACAAAVLYRQATGTTFSTLSLFLLLFLYVPFCFVLVPAARACYPAVLECFSKIMVVLAVVAIAQTAVQLLGVTYTDPFSYLPSDLVVSGYNTLTPVRYGSPVLRANAVFFLEPSFLSQFLALAFVISLRDGAGWRRLVLFGVGIAASVSGTGILLIAASVGAMVLLRGGTWLARFALPALIVVAAVQLTPAGSLFTDRATEYSEENSSFTQRFNAPFMRAEELVTSSDEAFFAGLGPGAADGDADEYFELTGLPINYSTFAKLTVEYGVPAALVFGSFILYAFFRRAPSATVGFGIAVLYLVLSGALLQPSTLVLCWMFTSLFAGDRSRRIRR